MSEGWHWFDQEKGYEVRVNDDGSVDVARHGEFVRRITAQEFEQWREEGDNPEGLE